jgi:hypothetical protein
MERFTSIEAPRALWPTYPVCPAANALSHSDPLEAGTGQRSRQLSDAQ